ncbi:MAG: hypothetical protein DWQ35_04025 [Planctomycetota bacterium]|nr:MAG: hypothetical protein DWQ35_04025 [Planctomycetota bacterium]REK21797.1 MAG: hypothetical protein DWQ42_19145 [Planctomycetota bacterium]REK43202.1 MAG: hypothetical protein DWQ46_12585 [Planctomycetota bacterium]
MGSESVQGPQLPDERPFATSVSPALSAAASRPNGRDTAWRVFVVGVVVCQIAGLSYAVEFSRGPMAYLAGPNLAMFAMLVAILTLLLAGRELLATAPPGRFSRWLGLAVNAFVFLVLLVVTRRLDEVPPNSVGDSWLVWSWPLLAVVVGLAALFSMFSVAALAAWLLGHWHHVVGSALLSLVFVIYVDDIQRCWRWTSRSSIAIATGALNLAWDEPIIARYRNAENPVIAVQREPFPKGIIRVTRYCAEMESLAAFWLIGLTAFIAKWGRGRVVPFLIVMVGGSVLLYVANGLRLALLSGIQLYRSEAWVPGTPRLVVDLAHSRISSMALLGAATLIVWLTARWWCPRSHGDKAEAVANLAKA